MTTELPSGLLIVETPPPAAAPVVPPRELSADWIRCQSCNVPAPERVQYGVFGGDLSVPYPQRWHSHRWTCRHGTTHECPTCYAKEGHYAECPVCGDSGELT